MSEQPARPKILLVEDHEPSRQMLSWRLDRKGFQVVEAKDGIEGLDAARRERPDLILLDMSLPALDGWTVARELKADPAVAAIPIIGVTAHAMRGDRERALEAGCDDYDTKPVEFARLLGKIEALLGG
jgi:two-component system cell cycle response regulator DivK